MNGRVAASSSTSTGNLISDLRSCNVTTYWNYLS
jgi:hypothetical protein